MAHDLGADSLLYLPLSSIPRAIGLPEKDLCMACINGEYPTEVGTGLYQISLAAALKQKAGTATADTGVSNRTYEMGGRGEGLAPSCS
jgi:amidophosphoribosyltransferase